MKNQNDITIPYSDLDDAVENIIGDRYAEYDETVNRDSIKKVLKEHLMYAIEKILSEPSEYFKSDRSFWDDLDNSVYLDDVA
jgi:5-bromo-4-chloroindolyl phosphate hydrolysis protein